MGVLGLLAAESPTTPKLPLYFIQSSFRMERSEIRNLSFFHKKELTVSKTSDSKNLAGCKIKNQINIGLKRDNRENTSAPGLNTGTIELGMDKMAITTGGRNMINESPSRPPQGEEKSPFCPL